MALKFFKRFFHLESSSAILLFIAAVLALIIDNTPWKVYYHHLLDVTFSVHLGAYLLSKPLLLWINDGLMAIFFLLVGLEIKRELCEGELNSLRKSLLPAIAAVGGMAVPALIYIYFNASDPIAIRGWAIPTATDIAFALGIIALLGSRVPTPLKIYLTALAIFDDIGAIIVIAIFYTQQLSLSLLLIALIIIFLLILLNRLNVCALFPYLVLGLALWVCVLKSGVHATLAGIVLAFVIPLDNKKKPDHSPLKYLEHVLHPWVAFLVLPIFAFANAGVSFDGISLSHFVHPIPIGIALGLFLGKQLGIWGATMLAVKTGIAKMPRGGTALSIYGLSLVAGIGFTMSLFIGSLAFDGAGEIYPPLVRMGVILGSIISGVLGYLILRYSVPASKR